MMARAVPRVSETAAPVNQKNYVDELVKRIPFEKIDSLLNSWASKFLRKFKILVLKLDNRISDSLIKFKANGNGKEVLNRDILQSEQGQKVEKRENQQL